MDDEKGQSLVEFAVSLVVILILLSGAVELGIGMFQFIQLRDAAQEGALFGSICQDYAKIEARARSASNSPIDLSSEDVLVEIENTADGGIKVSISYPHKVFMPFASAFLGNEISIKAYTIDTILIERDSCD